MIHNQNVYKKEKEKRRRYIIKTTNSKQQSYPQELNEFTQIKPLKMAKNLSGSIVPNNPLNKNSYTTNHLQNPLSS